MHCVRPPDAADLAAVVEAAEHQQALLTRGRDHHSSSRSVPGQHQAATEALPTEPLSPAAADGGGDGVRVGAASSAGCAGAYLLLVVDGTWRQAREMFKVGGCGRRERLLSGVTNAEFWETLCRGRRGRCSRWASGHQGIRASGRQGIRASGRVACACPWVGGCVGGWTHWYVHRKRIVRDTVWYMGLGSWCTAERRTTAPVGKTCIQGRG